jgi:hypothetical protein
MVLVPERVVPGVRWVHRSELLGQISHHSPSRAVKIEHEHEHEDEHEHDGGPSKPPGEIPQDPGPAIMHRSD